MSQQNLLFHPIISSIQRIALYETKTRFYLIGSNNTQTRFRVLKIDRTVSKELVLVDDKVEYNKQEIHHLLNMIGFGNRSGRSSGFNKLVSAFGIVGFIRFLEGYYIILVTKRGKIAVIGSHSIYKIEDTAMIYIPNDSSRPLHPDEQRYVKMFLAIDLSTNFYYSYSYDVTHTLQMNMAPPRKLAPALFPKPVTAAVYQSNLNSNKECTCNKKKDDEDIFETWKAQLEERQNKPGQKKKLEFGVRTVPEWRFVWNSHLLSVVHSQLHPDWILYIVHGFIEQSNLNIFGRPIYLTLIARRSNRYAGTRFLKRGANMHGDVANEVETEQIVYDAMIRSKSRPSIIFSSFVQMRGSIPSFWSQDISKMVPKPAIMIDRSDPYAEIPAKHINNLMQRYGSPIMILNLVKKREKKKHESLLTDVISNAVKYLNQFLPPDKLIQYFHLDMARMNKGADAKVLDKLSAIARTVVRRTGIFLSCKSYGEEMGVEGHQKGRLQTGLVRVNCVDCLDRTNTAQFAIGKCVLAHQLHALGLIQEPVIEFDSDCVRLLEGLYEDHGDTLALQYGGSQLVHRIKTYRKTAPWSSHGNDIMQTLSRYYSNTFSDAEKQNTMNLFLGLFLPEPNKPAIWEYPTDYYLHHPETVVYIPNRRSLTKWWDDEVLHYLPRPTNEMRKLCCEIIGLQGDALEMVDPYHEYTRPFEYTVFEGCFEFKMYHTLRDLAPGGSESLSPFVVRGRGVKGPSSKNPVISGRSSTTSNNSSDSNSDSTSDDDLTWSPSSRQTVTSPVTRIVKLLEAGDVDEEPPLFPAIKRHTRVQVNEPCKRDMMLYKRYVNFERRSNPKYKLDIPVVMTVSSAFTIDSSVDVIPPTVSRGDRLVYQEYVRRTTGDIHVPQNSQELYKKYVNFTV
ncbi:putative FIG4 protein [Danaus plexippus plexippus]|uniref:FIG4 protein n=1 Tax=Danaus plexippus plexippus TaxID=278856 RepID=A0A212F3G2_DANPL|nr:polyphosphoinositide phosphatase [Danaus plexippus plexippus]OWR48279.1 putative FIG4 protein [Danaus plexippus plexippus]